MANKYRGVTWNNAGAGPKVRVRRSIWLAELADFGLITDAPDDLPTRGALNRGSSGATSGTREYVNLSTVNDLAVVDTQDNGSITDTAISAAIWKTNSENTNVVVPATQADFAVASSSNFTSWNFGDTTNPINRSNTMGVYRLAQTMQTTTSSGNQEPGDSGYEVVTSANGGNAGTDIIGWRRINNPSTSSSTTYRVYSYQAMGINRNNATNQESGQQVIHAWDIEVPGNGALFVRPGQNAQRGVWGDPNNGGSLSYANGYTGGTGGVGQIMIYDPSVSTGTTIDGVATNSILAITSSGAGTSSSNGTTTSTITASTGFQTYYSTDGTTNIIQQGSMVGSAPPAYIEAYGGYPNGSGSTSLPRSDNGYTSTYVTPVNDWDGSEIGVNYGAVTGTNYYLGSRAGSTNTPGPKGQFVFVSGAVKDS